MSPRAACRLEALGFERVYDYVAGIADWKAAGLPVEGSAPDVQQVADATRPDIPTCNLQDTLGDIRSRTFAAGWDECVVVDCDGVVVGRLRDQAWQADTAATAEQVMESGPSTVRPHSLLEPLAKRMAERDTKLVLVTTPQGTLIGALIRAEAERLIAGEAPEEIWQECEGCPGCWAVKQ